MNTITEETESFQMIEQRIPADYPIGEGSKLDTSYFEFCITLPVEIKIDVSELSDEELLKAADKTRTFAFLDDPEEDGYNDLIPKRE